MTMLAEPDTPAHGAEGASTAFPQLDLSVWPGVILWTLIAFGLLYFALSRGPLRKLGGVIEDRQDKIADDLDRAAELKRQADDAEAAFENALAEARNRALGMAAQARVDLDQEVAVDTAAVESELAKRAAAADERIQAATAAALENVSVIATEAAAAMVEKLTGATPAADTVAAAVQARAARAQA